MQLAFFKLRLAFLLGYFLLQAVRISFRQLTTVFAAALITLTVLMSATLNMQIARSTAVQQQITNITLAIPGGTQRALTRDQVTAQIAQYEQLLTQQPQQRMLLINVALLYSALDDRAAAQQKWDQARALDPNHPAFTQ